jgi:hypothetical protein
VAEPVAGQERDPPACDLAEGDRGGRRAVGRLEGDLLDVVEQRVEAGAAVDPDVGARTAVPPSGVGHVVLAGVLELDESPLGDEEDEVDDEVSDDDEPPSDDELDDEPPSDDELDDEEDDDDDRLSVL